jgi:IS5 family transposase
LTDSDGKIVSIFEPHAQIIRRGKLRKPTEFGALVKVQEAEGGIVTDIGVVTSSHDSQLLVPSVKRHIALFLRPPGLAATDRGFFSLAGEQQICDLGVRRAVIPHCGYRSRQRIAHERQRWFRRGRAWRAGGEARISRLKHVFGMHRSRYRGSSGMNRTVYWAALANNLVAIGRAA